jgi:hypothetical protein
MSKEIQEGYDEGRENSRIATHQLRIRHRKSGKDSRAAEGGGGLAAAFIAVADVDSEGFGKGCFEGYCSAF